MLLIQYRLLSERKNNLKPATVSYNCLYIRLFCLNYYAKYEEMELGSDLYIACTFFVLVLLLELPELTSDEIEEFLRSLDELPEPLEVVPFDIDKILDSCNAEDLQSLERPLPTRQPSSVTVNFSGANLAGANFVVVTALGILDTRNLPCEPDRPRQCSARRGGDYRQY